MIKFYNIIDELIIQIPKSNHSNYWKPEHAYAIENEERFDNPDFIEDDFLVGYKAKLITEVNKQKEEDFNTQTFESQGSQFSMNSIAQADWNSLMINLSVLNITEENPYYILSHEGIPIKFISASEIQAAWASGAELKMGILQQVGISISGIQAIETLQELKDYIEG